MPHEVLSAVNGAASTLVRKRKSVISETDDDNDDRDCDRGGTHVVAPAATNPDSASLAAQIYTDAASRTLTSAPKRNRLLPGSSIPAASTVEPKLDISLPPSPRKPASDATVVRDTTIDSTAKRKLKHKDNAAKSEIVIPGSEISPMIAKKAKREPAVMPKRDNAELPPANSSKTKTMVNATAKTAKTQSKETTKNKLKRKQMDTEMLSGKANSDADDNDDDDADADEGKWWKRENPLGDGSIKWSTLRHNGVLFAPEYVPHNVPLLYDGKEVALVPAVEEVATFFATVLGTPYAENETFCKNFFKDFCAVIQTHQPSLRITKFEKCDFSRINEMVLLERERKKAMSKEEKEALKREKAEIEEKYGWAYVDGRREKVGNFRIEPPSLFRGRGAHPKTGTLKRRIMPEQITINIGAGEPVPSPPPGHSWKAVVNNNTVTWLAFWTENVNSAVKYVYLAANSSFKGISDYKKFEKARELKQHADRIRQEYTRMLRSNETVQRQLATALYFIDKFALRAGNQKGDDEADTVGCCSLRYEHVTLRPDNVVVFDFLGKDSIRYYNEVTVDAQVHRNLRIFKKDHKPGDPLFDRIDVTSLNKHLSSLMPGLSAKVFRTYNASITFQNELRKAADAEQVAASQGAPAPTRSDKILAYNRANRMVAILCNHQRAVAKTHDVSMERMRDKIRAIKLQRREIKAVLVAHSKAASSAAEKRRIEAYPMIHEPESDIDDEWITRYAREQKEKAREKKQKKIEKLVAAGESRARAVAKVNGTSSERNGSGGRNEDVKSKKNNNNNDHDDDDYDDDDDNDYADDDDNDNGGDASHLAAALTKGIATCSVDVALKKLGTLSDRIEAARTQLVDKDENKTTALGTSKINYLDPRITTAWCRRHDVPIERMFPKTLREKFQWAMEVDADWQF